MKNDTPNDTPFYYSMPFLLALCLHVLVLTFLILEINLPVKSTPGGSAASSQPIIHATAVSQKTLDNYENQVRAQREAVIKQQQLQQQIAREKIIQQQRQEMLKQQQIKQLELQKLQAIQAAKQKVIEAQEKAAAQQKAIAEKEAAQKAAEQKAVKLAEEKAVEKAQEKAEKKALQKALMKDMQKQLASDQSELNHNEKASKQHSTAATDSTSPSPPSQGMIDKYKALIIQAISSQWIVPPNLPQNISCELDVRVAPGGVVLQVSIVRSSGNPVLDNSAIAAVNKASPLPVPSIPGLFDQFRELHLTVKPDGSMTER